METQRTHLTNEESALLKELLRPGASVEAVIPPDATPDELWRTLDACVRGLGLLEARQLRLRPIIGRILLIFENTPSMYHDLGYESFSLFMAKGVFEKMGLHRTSAYDAKLAAKWPQITPDRYVQIGPKKLALLSKFTKPTSPNAESWLHMAETMKVKEFVAYSEQRGFLQPGEAVGATILITTNRAISTHYEEFFSNPRVHQKVGSKDRGEILEALIQECSIEWDIEGEGQEARRQ